MSVAQRYARDDMDAKDILSHSFVKVFRSIKAFNSEKGSFYAWLKKIISNEALDHIKQRSRFNPLELDKADEPHIESEVIEQMNEGLVLALVKQLPAATHAVFIMYVVDGYAHKEIAEKLGISEGTSKWHLSEARKILQTKIANLKN
jgi:RNA polymerase sigma-70 factor (ECF subfamily)